MNREEFERKLEIHELGYYEGGHFVHQYNPPDTDLDTDNYLRWATYHAGKDAPTDLIGSEHTVWLDGYLLGANVPAHRRGPDHPVIVELFRLKKKRDSCRTCEGNGFQASNCPDCGG